MTLSRTEYIKKEAWKYFQKLKEPWVCVGDNVCWHLINGLPCFQPSVYVKSLTVNGKQVEISYCKNHIPKKEGQDA